VFSDHRLLLTECYVFSNHTALINIDMTCFIIGINTTLNMIKDENGGTGSDLLTFSRCQPVSRL
jgi:hypothetical protein